MYSYVKQECIFPVVEIQDAKLKEAQSGNLGVELELVCEVSGARMLTRWTGWLSDRAVDKTIDALHDLGFEGMPKDLGSAEVIDFFSLPEGVSVTVKHEVYEGRDYFKGAFINKSRKRSTVDTSQLDSLIEKNNLNGLFMKKRKDAGIQNTNTKRPNHSKITLEDIPF